MKKRDLKMWRVIEKVIAKNIGWKFFPPAEGLETLDAGFGGLG